MLNVRIEIHVTCFYRTGTGRTWNWLKIFQWKRQSHWHTLQTSYTQHDSQRFSVYKTPYCYTVLVNTDLRGEYVHKYNHGDSVTNLMSFNYVFLVYLTKVWFRGGLQRRMVRWSLNSELKTRWKARIKAYMKPDPPHLPAGPAEYPAETRPRHPMKKRYNCSTSPSLLLSPNPQHSPSWEADSLLTGQTIYPVLRNSTAPSRTQASPL